MDQQDRGRHRYDRQAGGGFSIERQDDINTIAAASRKAKEYVQWATELQKTECSLDELYISVKCGESDTTSGLASNPTVGNAVDKLVEMGATTSFGDPGKVTIAAVGKFSGPHL